MESPSIHSQRIISVSIAILGLSNNMNFFGIGLPEMAVIFAIALLIFGPKKLPEIGRSMGKAMKSFQDASSSFQNEIKKEIDAAETVVADKPAAIERTEPKTD
jgi:sec-independent protein translocase protein TatA